MDSVGPCSPCRNVWMQSFLLLLSSLSSYVTALRNLLLSGVPYRCHSLWSLLFPSIFCLIIIGQFYALSVHLCSGIAFQPVQ
jgi:hypothetical protein